MAYDSDSIDVLEGLEPVRLRPGMYIGGVDTQGFHHLVWEIVDNSVDEAINGHASVITVTVSENLKTVTVKDNGRGIPVDNHRKTGRPALEVILTTLHAGGKFGGGSYKTSGGLHGVGSSVVNALSSLLEARVWKGGYEYFQAFAQGKPIADMVRVSPATGTGTQIQFTPDPDIFGDQVFNVEVIKERLEINSFLNRGLRICFKQEGAPDQDVDFYHEGGIAEYLEKLAEGGKVSDRPFLFDRKENPRLEVALTWTDQPKETFRSFGNGIFNPDGGTHESGLKDAIAKAIKNYLDVHDIKGPAGLKLTSEDIREGIVAVCSVFIPDPQFQGQTKDKLLNQEVRSQVDNIIKQALEAWLNENKSQADAIVARCFLAAKARMASREAGATVRRKSVGGRKLNLPGKLADCSSSDSERCELFLVEGDSAGGSAKQGRNREYQAILPLRGKVLNSESLSLKKVLENNELSDIVKALGCGIGKDLDLSHLRYEKIILLMDADSDGHHIATLLLTFLYRHLRPLIDAGHVYLAQPPLFRIDLGKQTWWAGDEQEKQKILKGFPPRAQPEISRFKGLGEMMPKTLYETTLDPAQRKLLQVKIPDGAHMETEKVITDLMGKDPQTRFQALTEWMAFAKNVDL